MHQTGCCLGLYPEFRYEIRIFGKFLLQHFHRYMPVQFVILCLINICHSAHPDALEHFVTVAYHCSYLNHPLTSSENGSIIITAILSLPPWSFAA